MPKINLNRIGQLLRWELMLHSRKFLAYLGPTLGVLYIISFSAHNGASGVGYDSFTKAYGAFLAIAGFIFVTSVRPEFGSHDGRQSYLTLPASNAEKWLATWFYSGPLFVIVYTLSYAAITLIINATFALLGWQLFEPLDLADHEALESIGTFLSVVHPLGLLGAIAFNRWAAAKTIGISMLVMLTLAALVALTFRMVYWDFFEGFWTPIVNSPDMDYHFNPSDWGSWISLVAGVFFLLVSYFRLQEKEV